MDLVKTNILRMLFVIGIVSIAIIIAEKHFEVLTCTGSLTDDRIDEE